MEGVERRCRCGSAGPFPKDSRAPDGLYSRCKACVRAESTAYRENNPEKRQVTTKSYYERNRSSRLIYFAQWRESHPNESLERPRLAKRRHPETRRASRGRDRARRAAAVSTLTTQEWLEILEYFGHACAYCLRTDKPLEQDHVIPLNKGGEHTAENVVPACRRDNARKHDRPIFLMVG